MSLNNLATLQSDVGEREAALATAQEAVKLRRELVQRNRDAFLPDFVKSCWTLGLVRLGLEQHKEAAQIFAEGAGLLLGYIPEHPFRPHVELAVALLRYYLGAEEKAGLGPDQQLMAKASEVLGPYLNPSGEER
jgi:hypothetical protein